MTLATTAATSTGACIEATGFGTRRILDAFAAREVPVTELIAVGGLAERSPLLLQIYADITRRPIAPCRVANASATGAAMLGAVAAGERAGGHASFVAAAAHMAALQPGRVDPSPARADLYDALYREYLELHDHFGRGGTAMMSRLRRVASLTSMETAPLLEAAGIGMTFPGVRALEDVDFAIERGEVHALVGENGAGKSTLIRILSGEITGYDGALRLDGDEARFATPGEAIARGIAVIPQELLLVGPLTASENVCLGHEPRSRLGFLDRAALAARATAALSPLGETALEDVPIRQLDTGQRQMVAIARALSLDARLVIMDEPTASLGAADVARLEAVVAQLSARGVAVVYVSHRLDEVLRLADRITVLRDGKRVTTRNASAITEPELVRLMVGRDIERPPFVPVPGDAEERLRIENLSVRDDRRPGGYRLRDVSFTVRRGEIVGLSGLVGAGRTDLLLALVGALENRVEGRITIDNQLYTPTTPAAAREAGMVLLPEERGELGLLSAPVRRKPTSPLAASIA